MEKVTKMTKEYPLLLNYQEELPVPTNTNNSALTTHLHPRHRTTQKGWGGDLNMTLQRARSTKEAGQCGLRCQKQPGRAYWALGADTAHLSCHASGTDPSRLDSWSRSLTLPPDRGFGSCIHSYTCSTDNIPTPCLSKQSYPCLPLLQRKHSATNQQP